MMNKRILATAAGMLALVVSGAVAAEQSANTARVVVGPVEVEVTTESLGNETLQSALRYMMGREPTVSEQLPPGEYWLGVRCEPLAPALRSQLNLDEKGGMVVTAVMPDSPAGKGGLQENDVIVKVGQEPLRRLVDLGKAVEEAKDTPLTLGVIRGGKPLELKVTPAKRPEALAGDPLSRLNAGETARLQRWLEEMLPDWQDRLPARLQFVRPGQILPSTAALAPLPDDMTVVITRHGKEPMKIVVEKGAQRWELSEKELEKLPAEVREHVERLINPLAQNWSVRVGDWAIQPPPEVRQRVERQMNEVHRQMDEVRKQLEEMRSRLPAAVPREPATPVEPKKEEPKPEKGRI